MNQYIEFDFETVEGRVVIIKGEKNGSRVSFKLSDTDGQPLKKNILTGLDVQNIEDLIVEYSEPETEYVSDFYNRYDD